MNKHNDHTITFELARAMGLKAGILETNPPALKQLCLDWITDSKMVRGALYRISERLGAPLLYTPGHGFHTEVTEEAALTVREERDDYREAYLEVDAEAADMETTIDFLEARVGQLEAMVEALTGNVYEAVTGLVPNDEAETAEATDRAQLELQLRCLEATLQTAIREGVAAGIEIGVELERRFQSEEAA